MAITATNIKPVEFNSNYVGSLAGDFNPAELIKNEMVHNLFTPLIASAPATIENDNTPLTEDDITQLIISCSGDYIDVDAERTMKEIFSQTLINYDPTLPIQDIYATQVGKKIGLVFPSDRVRYSTDDVSDAAKGLLSGQVTGEEWFATVSFYARINAFGYYFANDAAWSEFKTWFDGEIKKISFLLTQETLDLCNDMCKIRLNYLTQSFVLRDDDTQNNDPYTFARIFPFYLMMYERQMKSTNQPDHIAGLMPFSFGENICPKVIIISNVEKHAHAHPHEIKNEWNTIKSAMMMKPKVMGLNKIAKLTAVARMAQKISSAPGSSGGPNSRSAIIRLRKTPPTSIDLYNYIKRIYRNATYIQSSENAMKCQKLTYQKPSRREPDNPDRQGKVTNVKFKPDLHIYLDCSGSISERNYQDAIKTCIKLASKMNINIYFNSFSHIMSATTKLHIKDRTMKDIYDEFKNTPKVAGGTDYEQIWHYINRSDKRRKEVSIIISDFEYYPPNHYVQHPRFLYYAPISATNWNLITESAKRFIESMLPHHPRIRKNILM